MIKTKENETVSSPVQERGEFVKIEGREYFIRSPKAKDMIFLEKEFKKKENQSNITQALVMLSYLSKDNSLNQDYLSELYMQDLAPVFSVMDKLVPSMSATINIEQ